MNTSTLAVLPFPNISAGPGNPYFRYGLSVEIIKNQAKIQQTCIISGASASVYMVEDDHPGSVERISKPLPLTIPFPLFRNQFYVELKK